MDTSHHHLIAYVGERLIKQALARSHREDLNIGAFYLGNWLTDVSQVVDPVAYANANAKAQALLDSAHDMLDQMVRDLPGFVREGVEKFTRLDDALNRFFEGLQTSIREILSAGRDARLAKGFHSLFWGAGYFKFVVDDKGQATEMDPQVYDYIYQKRFTQYYPHEHLDRPAKGNGLASETGMGPISPITARPADVVNRDLYDYLRYDIQVAAGILALLDGGVHGCYDSWASATFHPTAQEGVVPPTEFRDDIGALQSVSDKNPVWCEYLARLGHALHAVEDFFAHSTFVELCSLSVPPTYNLVQRWEDAEIVKRRLLRWEPKYNKLFIKDDELRGAAAETHVVTGYFDFVDTLHSLSHVLDHLLERPTNTIGSDVDTIREYEYGKLFDDLMSFIDSPKDAWETTSSKDEDEVNRVAKFLREQVKDDLESWQRLQSGDERLTKALSALENHPKFRGHGKAFEMFKDAANIFGRANAGRNLWKSLKQVREILAGPAQWLRSLVPNLLRDEVKEYLEVYAKRWAGIFLGSQRIGCHTLIAKDTGPEVLHQAAMNCAKVVHEYVIGTLVRHAGHEPSSDVCRWPDGAVDQNVIPEAEEIDWLELLESFLTNPTSDLTRKPGTLVASGNLIHTTRKDPQSQMSPDTLRSLAKEYAPTFLPVPGHVQTFSWEVIADANFGTGMYPIPDPQKNREQRVNKILKQDGTGIVVGDGVNHAFRAGRQVIIPYQETTVSNQLYEPPKSVKDLWWYQAITKGPEHGLRAIKHVPVPLRNSVHLERVEEADKRREQLEKEYK